MRPAFLCFSNGVFGKFVKRIPDRPQNFVDESHSVGPAPPGRQPGNPVVLIDHQIKFRLRAIPPASFNDRTANSAPAHDVDAADACRACGPGKRVRKPKYLVPARDQRFHITLRHPFGSSRQRILRIAPVKHQKTHARVCLPPLNRTKIQPSLILH